jgi:hypothetical protein
MDSFFTGSVQSWLAVVVATLSPLTALIVGFEGPIGFSGDGSGRCAITRHWRALSARTTVTAPARQVEQLRPGEVSRPTLSDREFRNLTRRPGLPRCNAKRATLTKAT